MFDSAQTANSSDHTLLCMESCVQEHVTRHPMTLAHLTFQLCKCHCSWTAWRVRLQKGFLSSMFETWCWGGCARNTFRNPGLAHLSVASFGRISCGATLSAGWVGKIILLFRVCSTRAAFASTLARQCVGLDSQSLGDKPEVTEVQDTATGNSRSQSFVRPILNLPL